MPPHDVHVWFRATGSLDEAAMAAAVLVLSDDERALYERFHFAHDARDYAAAHALLRTALSHDSHRAPGHWRFDKTKHGQPFLMDRNECRASFSLSHTGGMVACAVTKEAVVGVDVECVDRAVNAAGIAARFFAPAEAADLMQLDGDARRERFFDLWTLKEALVKALGAGMAMSLGSLAFTISDAGQVRLKAPPEIAPASWQFGLFAPGPRHGLAVAVRRSSGETAQLVLQSLPDAG